MRNVLIAAVLFASLLAFGCVTPQQPPIPTLGATAEATVLATSTPAPVAASAITGKGYNELVAMGKTLECDLTVTSEGGTLTGKAYIKGGSVRIDGTMTAAGQSIPMIEVFKDEIVYTNVPEGMETLLGGEQCDWLKFDPAKIEEQTQSVQSKPVETNTLDDKTKSTFTCREGWVDDSKFAIASSCDMTEIINKMMGALTQGVPTAPAGGTATPTITPIGTPSGTPAATGPVLNDATCSSFRPVPDCAMTGAQQALCQQCKAAGYT